MTSTSQRQNRSWHLVPHRILYGSQARTHCIAGVYFAALFCRAAFRSGLLYLTCVLRVPWKTQLVQIGGTSSNSLWMKMTWRELRFPVMLLWIYSATKKELTLPHDAQAGTIPRCRYLLWFDTIATPVTLT